MVKEIGRKVIAQNKKARHDYAISDGQITRLVAIANFLFTNKSCAK